MSKHYALIIDDDADVANWLGTVLSADGIQVVKTKTAEQGVEMLGLQNFDLIFIDIFMPGIGGIAGIQEIRAQKSDAQIIAMSAGYDGMTTEIALAAAEKIGADKVLAKPLSIEAVQAALT